MALEKPLSGFDSFSLAVFGWLARPLTKDSIGLRNVLVKARIPMLPVAYAATSMMMVFLTFVVCAALTLVMLIIAPNLTSPTGDPLLSIPIQIGLCFFLLVIVPALIGAVQMYSPGLTSYQRGRDMEKNIPYAAERNPLKWSKKMPGSERPIISEKTSRSMKPDYYLVLPWHFKDNFIKREKKYLSKGGKLIFPLPKIEIFSKKKLKNT